MSYAELLWSMLGMHNETMNIWTHFLPFAYTGTYMVLIAAGRVPEVAGHEGLMMCACLAEFFCFACSSVYHLFKDKDERHCQTLLQLDLVGILVMIFGLALTCVWVGFSLHPAVRG